MAYLLQTTKPFAQIILNHDIYRCNLECGRWYAVIKHLDLEYQTQYIALIICTGRNFAYCNDPS